MDKSARDEILMANAAELICRSNETRVRILIVTVVATLFGIRRVLGRTSIRFSRFFLFLGLALFGGCLYVVFPTILLGRRHSRHTVENGGCNFISRDGVAAA